MVSRSSIDPPAPFTTGRALRLTGITSTSCAFALKIAVFLLNQAFRIFRTTLGFLRLFSNSARCSFVNCRAPGSSELLHRSDERKHGRSVRLTYFIQSLSGRGARDAPPLAPLPSGERLCFCSLLLLLVPSAPGR